MNPRFNKIYVLAPYNYATGGVELSHQLVDYLNVKGADAYIVYIKNDIIIDTEDITKAYRDYNIKVANTIEDREDNFLVIPEIYFDWMYKFNKIQYGCWWMSVDNHYKACSPIDAFMFKIDFKSKLTNVGICIKLKSKNKVSDIRKLSDRTYHFYQSRYAQYHLYNKRFNKVLPLGDYINIKYLNEVANASQKREDIVLYNPAKGIDFTKKIIKSNPDIKFIALKGFSSDELRELMQRAKLYIDFGNFPGKDRLPRESVMNGLCVITGTKGASGFYEDLPIDSKYKIEAKKGNIKHISNLIADVLNNFESHTSEYDFWRSCILKEEEEFQDNIDSFFFRPQ